MIANMKAMLDDARREHYAIGSFNCPNFEIARAAVRAAEDLGIPVILNHGEGHDGVIALEDIAPVLLMLAERAKVPVCVHIDHGMTRPFLMRAIRRGFTSIMYDCSMLPFDENKRRIKAFVDEVHPLNITVEAELGNMLNNIPHFEGNASEDELDNLESTFTDPEAASEFVQYTGVDALTVSFGSMHGAYKKPPRLDIDRLDQIRAGCGDCALVMHGASGIDMDQVKRAVRHGVQKINYYTAIATAPTEGIQEMIEAHRGDVVFFHEISKYAGEVMYEEIRKVADAMANPLP